MLLLLWYADLDLLLVHIENVCIFLWFGSMQVLLWRNHLWAVSLKEELEVGGLIACIAWIFRPSILRKIIELPPQPVRQLCWWNFSLTNQIQLSKPHFSKKSSFSVWMIEQLLSRTTLSHNPLQHSLPNRIWPRLETPQCCFVSILVPVLQKWRLHLHKPIVLCSRSALVCASQNLILQCAAVRGLPISAFALESRLFFIHSFFYPSACTRPFKCRSVRFFFHKVVWRSFFDSMQKAAHSNMHTKTCKMRMAAVYNEQ